MSDKDLRTRLSQFFNHYNTPSKKGAPKPLVRISTFIENRRVAQSETSAFRMIRVESGKGIIRGVMGYGEYGRPGTIHNVDTDSHILDKSDRDADLSRFYFLLYIPTGHKVGVLMCQKTSMHSPKRALCLAMQHWLNSDIDPQDHILVRTGVLAKRSVVERYLSESVTKSVSIKTVVKDKDARAGIKKMSVAGNPLDPGTQVEIKFSRTSGFSNALHERIADAISGTRKSNDIVSMVGLNANSVVSVETATHRGKRRTINMSRIDETGLSYDITDEIRWRNGEATYESVDKYATELLGDIANEIPTEDE